MIIKLLFPEIHHELGFIGCLLLQCVDMCHRPSNHAFGLSNCMQPHCLRILGKFSLCNFVPTEAGGAAE